MQSVLVAGNETVYTCKGTESGFSVFDNNGYRVTTLYGNDGNNLSFSRLNNKIHMNLSSSLDDHTEVSTVEG